MYGPVKILQRRINWVAMTEFNLVILILLIRNALLVYSICCFILRQLSIWTPKNLTDSVIFNGCPYIVIDVSLIKFLCEKLIRFVFPGLSLILHLSHHVRIWFRCFCNLNVDTANTWSLCPNCHVICKLREVYLCIKRFRNVINV